MKDKIQTKLDWHQKIFNGKLDNFLVSNTRVDRDRVIKARERILVYKELLKEE